ncbi:MAG: HAD family hydrolase [bacterium]|nr:HAD family hydrolase [bacterium]
MYKGIIFDYGNTLTHSCTLADSLEKIVENPKSRDIGLSIEKKISNLYKPDQVKQPHWINIWKESFEEYGVVFSESIGIKHLEEFTRNSKTYSYTRSLLTELKANGIKIALLSNVTGATEIFANDLINRDLDQFFDIVAWSCDIGYRKPSLQSFNYVIEKLNLNKSSIIMVGDSEIADIKGSLRAGLDCIKIEHNSMQKSEATYRVKRENAFDEILSIVIGG